MILQVRLFPVTACIMIFMNLPSFAQTFERRPTNSAPQAQEQLPRFPLNATSLDIVANEIGLLRKSVQTLNIRLRELSEKVRGPDTDQGGSPSGKENRIALNLDILTRAEQRSEVLRKLLLELIEKETGFKNRLVQLEEDTRPESIERATAFVGSTRSAELRDVRRRVLENERKGLDGLLSQTAQSRLRLEDDVKQADGLVSKLRLRLLPVIEKEIEKINPN